MANEYDRQDALYSRAAAEFADAVARLARAYEPDTDRRRDLLRHAARLELELERLERVRTE